MTLHLPATRAAEDFDRALNGTAEPHVAERYASLVATATLLREQPAPSPRPEFVTELRAQLMAAAVTELVPGPRLVGADGRPAQRRSRLRERHLGAAAAAAVLVATTAGVAAAADTSLPGDTLYPVKRGLEQLQIAMNSNDAARGAEHLRLAGERLDEVEGLLENGASVEQIGSALTAYSEHAEEGSHLMFRAYQSEANPNDIAAVREFTTTQVRQVEEIADLAPPTSTSEFGAVAGLLSEIDQQARVLCQDCSGAAAVAATLADPNATDPIIELVAAPVESAIQTLRQVLPPTLGDDARAAERTARNTPKLPTLPEAGDSTTGQTPGQTSPTDALTQPVKPLTDIVDNVTTGLPLPETVKRITRPITDPLTGTVDGLLDGTLGTLSKLGGN